MADIKDTYGAAFVGKKVAITADPFHLTLVGIDPANPAYVKGVDIPLTDAKGMVTFAKFADPDRLASAPSEEFIASIVRHGVKSPILIARFEGRTLASEGRQRIMGARLATLALKAKGDDHPFMVPAMTEADKAADPEVTMVIGNELRKEDTILAKARKMARLEARGYDNDYLAGVFGHKGHQTLANWRLLLACTPAILAEVDAGTLAPSFAYELGKLPAAKQAPALAHIRAENGATKGAKGKENVQAAAEALAVQAPEPVGNPLADTEPVPTPARTPRIQAAGRKLSPAVLRELHSILEPAEAADGTEEFTDEDCEVAYRLLSFILGDDPTAAGLEPWGKLHRFAKNYARSEDA